MLFPQISRKPWSLPLDMDVSGKFSNSGTQQSELLLHLGRYEGVSRSRYLRRLRHRRWCAQFELQPQLGFSVAGWLEKRSAWVERNEKHHEHLPAFGSYEKPDQFTRMLWSNLFEFLVKPCFSRQNIWIVVDFILQFQCSHRYL